MTHIQPFKAIRPVRDKVQLVASRPYYAYTKRMLAAKLKSNPYTFIHIINPEFHKKNKTKPNTKGRFLRVKERFNEFFEEGIFLQDEKDSIYVYRQTKDGHQYLGFIGGADLNEYKAGKIKKHEETITKREATFSKYLKTVGFNAEPVLLFHKHHDDLNSLLLAQTKVRAEYEYTTTDRVKHELWVIDDENTLQEIQHHFNDIEETYIADGHHRCASSARYFEESEIKSKVNQHALAFFISDQKLNILDFNRVVKDLNGLSIKSYLEIISNSFIIKEKPGKTYAPKQSGEISMYLEQKWYSLTPLPELINYEHPVERLDTYILTQLILQPILNIQDLKEDERIDFVSGDKGMKGLKKVVDKGVAKVAFGLFPISPRQLIDVADANLIMPPKSTWIEPKLRSGLTIYPLETE
ncbi:DUF1015 domain-containing protein [Putridiphycobacter roseus]|uniref:DUF1015 domain-containing protein n=1 Tax=Putridiphycobacter roseus TaxID=2219161 RepID=UPI001313D968|nr:DUF1015 domain-containing protein [Putridiphycobacter roseus]